MKTDALPVRCSCRPIEPTGFVHKRPHSPACWTSAVPLCLRSGCRAVRIAPALLHPGRAGCTLRAADAPAGALAKNFPLILPARRRHPPTRTPTAPAAAPLHLPSRKSLPASARRSALPTNCAAHPADADPVLLPAGSPVSSFAPPR